MGEAFVFVAETVDAETEQARALDRWSGREIWRRSWPGRGSVPFFARRNGDWIRSTPALDGEALYVGSMQEVLRKLDAETGAVLWTVDFPRRFATAVPDFGFASSPLVDGGAVYVQAANSLVKLDAATGETIWRILENDGAIFRSGAFSSPLIAQLAGQRQLLVQTREVLYGVRLDDGEILWQQPVPSFRGMNILTPTVYRDSVLTSTHRNRTFLYDIAASAGTFSATERWTHKAQGYMSSPVVVDSFAYLHLGNGRLVCLDLESGQETWTSTPLGDYWSLLVQEDKILGLSSDGDLYLLRANPQQLEVLDSRSVSDQQTWGHVAVSEGQIFVRELEGIVAYAWPAGVSASEGPPTANE